jgi:hypothetical protein
MPKQNFQDEKREKDKFIGRALHGRCLVGFHVVDPKYNVIFSASLRRFL